VDVVVVIVGGGVVEVKVELMIMDGWLDGKREESMSRQEGRKRIKVNGERERERWRETGYIQT